MENNDNLPKEKKPARKESKKTLFFATLIRENPLMTVKEAANISGLSERRGYSIRKQIKDNPKLHQIAVHGIVRLAKGETYGEITEIKDSTSKAACEVILDRTEPKVIKSEVSGRTDHVHTLQIKEDTRASIVEILRSFLPGIIQKVVENKQKAIDITPSKGEESA